MRHILIIGATSGIGRALAECYLKRYPDVRLALTGRRQALLEELQAMAPSRIVIQKWDVTRDNNASQLAAVIEKLGGLDLAILSSGIGRHNPQLDWQPEKETIDTNVVAFTEVCGLLAKALTRLSDGDRRSRQLTAISSIAAIRGDRGAPAYNASKAFQANYLEGLRKHIRHTLKNGEVAVTDIRPGFIDTEMTRGQKGMFWVASAEKAAEQIVWAIEKKKRVAYITQRWALIAWLLRLVPAFLYERF